MTTLQELVRYCSEEKHYGAFLLTGEWGCGKTYLIETELAEALRTTHFIVRVSLLGLDSVNALNEAVRRQWLYICTPVMGKLKAQREQAARGSRFFSAANSLLSMFNPIAGNVASAVAAFDPLEYVPLETEVEDHHDGGEKKKVVLVFDDVDRSGLDLEAVVGCINEYCENMGFLTVIIANEEAIRAKVRIRDAENGLATYMMAKEKTVTRTVQYVPDYPEIIRRIINGGEFTDPEYAAFLSENEAVILDAFASDPPEQEDGLGKYHNIRSLICALREFYRVYGVLKEKCVRDKEQYLYSFIACMLVMRNGISKDGHPCYEVSEEELKRLYPTCSSDAMPESIRQWIEYGIWDEEAVLRDIFCEGK